MLRHAEFDDQPDESPDAAGWPGRLGDGGRQTEDRRGTLLLSAQVHPNQVSHRLEAIAGRLDVPVLGRHTALGDAMLTAQVFQQLLPLLAAMGIDTLGQARAAAQKTFYAWLTY